MNLTIQITVEGDSIEDHCTLNFDPIKAQKLKECSELVGHMYDERYELDPDNTEPIQIHICGQGFGGNDLKTAINYLEHYDYIPPVYGKIISNELRKNCQDEYDTKLAHSYNFDTIKRLHSCASYFQISSQTKLCYIRIGCEFYINTNESGAVQKMMDKFGIMEAYTIQTETELKNQYPFLKNTNGERMT